MAIDPSTLTLEELTATYPPAVVDFLLTANADATLCVPNLAGVQLLTPDGPDLEVRTTLEHVTAYVDGLTAAGYGIAVMIPARVPA